MTTLYDLTCIAYDKIDTMKRPNVDEWRDAIDDVLEAAGLPTIGHDHIHQMVISRTTLSIVTQYTVRGCAMHNDIDLPMSIVQADDPITAAKRWSLETRISRAESAMREAARQAALNEAIVERLRHELNNLPTTINP